MSSQSGTDFYLGFMTISNSEFLSPFFEPRIIVTTNFTRSVDFVIKNLDGTMFSGSVNSSNSVTYAVPHSMSVYSNENTIVNKGLHVSASRPINVISALQSHIHPHDLGAVCTQLIFPRVALDVAMYEYLAIPGNHQFRLHCLLVGNEDGTSITITPPYPTKFPKQPNNIHSEIITVPAGSPYSITLNKLQTFQYSVLVTWQSTQVLSDKPLTVIVGNKCHSSQVYPPPCYPLYAQIPPVITWGMRFLLAPFAGRANGQYYKVVAAQDGTRLTLTCTDHTEEEWLIKLKGYWKHIYTKSGLYCFLQCSQVVLVIQIPTYDSHKGTSMILIPSTEEYSSSFVFQTPTGYLADPDNKIHYISIIVIRESFIDQLLFDAEPIPSSVQWTRIYSSNGRTMGHGCGFEISKGLHTLEHPSGKQGIFAMVYGFQERAAYGYPAGITSAPSKDVLFLCTMTNSS